MKILFVTILLCVLRLTNSQKKTCDLPMNYVASSRHLHKPFVMSKDEFSSIGSSLFIDVDTPKFLYPKIKGKKNAIVLEDGQEVVIFCTGRHNHLLLTKEKTGILECQDGSLSLDDWEDVSWADCSCKRRNKSVLRRSTKKCAEPTFSNARIHAVGWKLDKKKFIPQLTICFDHDKETTLYVIHRVNGKALDSKVTDSRRPSFKTGSLFKSSVKRFYKRVSQKTSIGKKFGIKGLNSRRGSNFLARGHLSPDADYSLLPEQDATYYYSNVVPQWQAINNGNWKQLEETVRVLASSSGGRTLMVYTGTSGVMALPEEKSGQAAELYLEADKARIPVPAITWKVIVDPKDQKASLILHANIPFEHEKLESMMRDLGTNICHLLPWVDWDTRDHSKGFTHCLTTEHLHNLIPYAPDLPNLEPLTT